MAVVVRAHSNALTHSHTLTHTHSHTHAGSIFSSARRKSVAASSTFWPLLCPCGTHGGAAATHTHFSGAHWSCSYSTSKKLISWDEQNDVHKYKESFSVEIAPVCKDDLVCLPASVAHRMGTISPLVLCTKVTGSLHVIDCNTLQRKPDERKEKKKKKRHTSRV